ncbi:LD-carboxypeptidase [Puteibacter caeruleilacunae]|nr:LD-carboxypeptidase [Puteibacter caeruleilacunae]
MIQPSPLQKGDTIAILSPAGKIDAKHVQPAVELLKELGFLVKTGEHIFSSHFQFAGTDEQRASDLQQALDDENVKAIICSRGGYGSLRTLQKINWDSFLINPKWIVGFSDVTVFHNALHQMNMCSVHGSMPRFFFTEKKPNDSFQAMLNSITGEANKYQIDNHPLNQTGSTTAPIIGGNLSILYSLRGTPYDIKTKGKILFIEDLSEYLYHLDRIMLNLKVGGKLNDLAGLIVGGFTDMKDNDNPFGRNAYEIISDAVKEFDYPVCFNFPAGHELPNMSLKMGALAQLTVSTDYVELTQQ